MINVDGKVYRNIQEQVKKNQEDIESCEEKIANQEAVIGNLQIDIDSKIPLSQKGVENGVATLNEGARIPNDQMPEYPTFTNAEISGDLNVGDDIYVTNGGVKIQDDNNDYTGVDNFSGADIDTTYYSKGINILNADDDTNYNLSFPAKDGTLATTDDIQESKYAYTYVNTTTYTTLDSFLATKGESQYIYLYPIDTTDTSKGYYKYVWLNNAWFLDGQNSLQLIKGNVEVVGDITQKIDTTNYFVPVGQIFKDETTFTINDKTFTYQDLVIKVSIIGNVMNILWIGQFNNASDSITRQEVQDAMSYNHKYISLPPEIIAKISTDATFGDLGNGFAYLLRGIYDFDDSAIQWPYNLRLSGGKYIDLAFYATQYGSPTSQMLAPNTKYQARLIATILLSDNLLK